MFYWFRCFIGWFRRSTGIYSSKGGGGGWASGRASAILISFQFAPALNGQRTVVVVVMKSVSQPVAVAAGVGSGGLNGGVRDSYLETI